MELYGMPNIIMKNDFDAVKILVEHLSAHRLAIIPCDTIYGIVGSVPHSERDLRMVKGREETKPFIQLIVPSMLQQISKDELDPEVLAFWPGPLTVIVRDRNGGTVAVRVPADPFLQQVIESLGTPIYSTSVNFAGEMAFTRFSDMVRRFGTSIDLFIQGEADQGTVPSTIIDATSRPYTLVQQGAVDVSSLVSHSEVPQ
jgi:L-threonylcarbamoyladenylate synthase